MIELDRKKQELEPRPQRETRLRTLDGASSRRARNQATSATGSCSARPTRNTGVVTRIGTPAPCDDPLGVLLSDERRNPDEWEDPRRRRVSSRPESRKGQSRESQQEEHLRRMREVLVERVRRASR